MFEEIGVFVRGLIIGVMVAAPVGPVGLLCIRRTIQKGVVMGFATGFGAAFADAFFSALAALSVVAVTEILTQYQNGLYAFGGLFLGFIAWHTWHDTPRQADPDDVERRYMPRVKAGGVVKAMLTSFIITLTNPATLFGVLGVVAAFGGLKGRFETSAFIAGIFCGSALWWALLSGGVSLVRNRVTDERVMAINRVTAVVLAVIAAGAVAMGVWNLI